MLRHDDVVYMIMTDRFADGDSTNNEGVDRSDPMKRHGGDLLGIVQRMAYLKSLGVTTIWITPVYLNPPDSYHGYHPLDFESVDPHLCSAELGPVGGRETIRRFVEIAHANGLKVMLDMIVTHTGEAHPWREHRRDWINWDRRGVEKEWFKGLPNLDHDNLDVNVYFVLNVLRWIAETDIDAVRIDAARHIESRFWRYFKLYAIGEFPGVTVVGEFWDGNPEAVAVYQNRHGFDAMFDFPLYHAIRDVFIRDVPFGRLLRPQLHDREPRGILDLDEYYRNAMRLITFVGNHDTPRFFTEAGGETDPDRALRRLMLAQAFLFCTRGIPQIYYGDELALPGGDDPDNRRDMPWEMLEGNTATGGVNGSADQGWGWRHWRAMLDYTRRLIELRRASPALTLGLRSTLYVTDRVLVLLKGVIDDIAITAFNNSDERVTVRVPLRPNPQVPALLREMLGDGTAFEAVLGCDGAVLIEDGGVVLDLPPRTAAVFRAEIMPQKGEASILSILKERRARLESRAPEHREHVPR